MERFARVEQNPDVTNKDLPTLYFVTYEGGNFYLNLKIPIIASLVESIVEEPDAIVQNYRDLLITEKPDLIKNQYNAGLISTTFTKSDNANHSSGAMISFRASGGGKVPGTGEFHSFKNDSQKK